MSDDPYSRHYWRWADEYPELYDNDATCALWYRLVRLADMAWPSAATLPFGIRKAALDALVAAELVIRVTATTYRIRGMDKERGKRAQSASNAARSRWSDATRIAPGNATRTATRIAPGNAETMPSRAEPSKAEPSRAARDPADDYFTLTGRYPTDRTLTWLDDIAAEFGADATAASLATEYATDAKTATLIGRVRDRLRRDARALDRAEQAAERERLAGKRRPVTVQRAPDDISDEEAERLAREYREGVV